VEIRLAQTVQLDALHAVLIQVAAVAMSTMASLTILALNAQQPSIHMEA
jgi:hypothetical protein